MLAQEAVERAYREAALKTLNSPAFTAAEINEGLTRLNGFLLSLFGAEIGEVLGDWQVPTVLRTAERAVDPMLQPFPNNLSDWQQPYEIDAARANSTYVFTPPQNARLLCRVDQAARVYFPSNPNDGARMAFVDLGNTASVTLDGNGRLITGSTEAILPPGQPPTTWFYRADLAQWIELRPLTLTDPSPLPVEFDELLVAGTAIRLVGLDTLDPTSSTMFIYQRLLARCKQRYTQHANIAYGGQVIPRTDTFAEWGTRLW